MLVGKGEKVLVSVAGVAVKRRIRSPYSSSRAKPPTGRRSRGTYSCRRHNEQVPCVRRLCQNVRTGDCFQQPPVARSEPVGPQGVKPVVERGTDPVSS